MRVALLWWLSVLELEIAEQRAWSAPAQRPVYMFVDARGRPARVAAVAYIDGVWHYTDGAPSHRLMSRFASRSDNQITSLELLAIAVRPSFVRCACCLPLVLACQVGLSTFEREVAGRRLVLYSDNSGAEASTRKGAGAAPDQNKLIHEVWTQVRRWISTACLCRSSCMLSGVGAWHAPVDRESAI